MASVLLLGALLAGTVLSIPTANHDIRRRWDNGLAQTPPMGWNSYNHYSCSPNESIIMSNAQALVDLGLAELGYNYATTDCGWTIPDRTANGTITWNATLFPNGFPALGEFIHGLGLRFGVYSDAGIKMCMTGGVSQTGSLSRIELALRTYARQILKYQTTSKQMQTLFLLGEQICSNDNCYSDAATGYPDSDYTPSTSPASRYTTMHQAIINTGRSILYQICEWGIDFPSAWAPALGDTWRVTNDIIPEWKTVYRIVNQVVPQTSFAGPHQWLDLDMLEVGNNVFTTPEEQTHFSLWAILKSPLVIGAALKDTLTTINPTSLDILKNKDVIALNQDSLGVSANLTRRWTEAGYDVWAGPLSGNRTVAALVNWNDYALDATLDFADVGLQSAGSVYDIWNNITVKSVQTSYSKTVAAHGTLLLQLGETLPAGTPPKGTFYPSTAFTTAGTASHYTCNTSLCAPVGSKIINLTRTGNATIKIPRSSNSNNTSSTSTTKYVELTYINNDVSLSTSWTTGRNARNITISINSNSNSSSSSSGAAAHTTRLEVPLSGHSSELFSPMNGWGDSAVLGLLVDGWGAATVDNDTHDDDDDEYDVVVIGNVGGDEGVQPYGADFVGLTVF